MLRSTIKFFSLMLAFYFILPLGPVLTAELSTETLFKSANEVLIRLDGTNATSSFIDRWDAYLKSVYGFNNSEHNRAIRHLTREYHKAIINYNKRLKECSEESSFYSSEWIDALIKHFGKEKVVSKSNDIRLVLMLQNAKQNEVCSAEIEKEVLYREALFRDLIGRYITSFLEFFESLDKESQQRLLLPKKNCETFMEILAQGSIQHFVTDNGLRSAMFKAAVNNRVDSDIAKILSQHPNLSRPFDIFKAIAELKSLSNRSD